MRRRILRITDISIEQDLKYFKSYALIFFNWGSGKSSGGRGRGFTPTLRGKEELPLPSPPLYDQQYFLLHGSFHLDTITLQNFRGFVDTKSWAYSVFMIQSFIQPIPMHCKWFAIKRFWRNLGVLQNLLDTLQRGRKPLRGVEKSLKAPYFSQFSSNFH